MKNIAVIGAGYWGQNLVRNFYQLGALKIVCDVNDATLKKMKDQYPGIETTTDYDVVLGNQNIQGIVIGLPVEYHYAFAEKGLSNDKDIYVEKPLALDLE